MTTLRKLESQTESSQFNDYVPQHDEAEIERLKELYRHQGIGDINIEDDEINDVLNDFGIQVDLGSEK